MKDERSKAAIIAIENDCLTDEIKRDAYAAYAAAYAAYAAKKENQLKTANICRKILGGKIIQRVNELLSE